MKRIITILTMLLLLTISIFGESGKGEGEVNKTVESRSGKDTMGTAPGISKIGRPIILDTDTDFLSEPLPSKDPQRYRKWRGTARINVGQSHLSTADLTGDGRYLLAMSEMEAMIFHFKTVMEGVKAPVGEAYFSIENPKGELGFYFVSDGSAKPVRWRIRPPSFINLAALPKMAEGHLIADLIAINASVDIVMGEIDR